MEPFNCFQGSTRCIARLEDFFKKGLKDFCLELRELRELLGFGVVWLQSGGS